MRQPQLLYGVARQHRDDLAAGRRGAGVRAGRGVHAGQVARDARLVAGIVPRREACRALPPLLTLSTDAGDHGTHRRPRSDCQKRTCLATAASTCCCAAHMPLARLCSRQTQCRSRAFQGEGHGQHRHLVYSGYGPQRERCAPVSGARQICTLDCWPSTRHVQPAVLSCTKKCGQIRRACAPPLPGAPRAGARTAPGRHSCPPSAQCARSFPRQPRSASAPRCGRLRPC